MDPALAPFLALLETDLATRPAEAVQPLPKGDMVVAKPTY